MLSVTEAAARIGVSRSTIKSAARNKRLPSVKQHGLILIKASDLEAYRAAFPGGVVRRGRPPKQQPGQDEGGIAQ